jgi:anti-sigma regulatory factor (Ser/Thr protein kinase)
MIGGTGTVTGRTSSHRPERGSGAGAAIHRAGHLELAPLPTAIGCCRLPAVAVLKEWGLPRELIEDAERLVSELMTNAADASIVLPERPPVALRLLASETALVIEAWDQSPLDLEPREAGADDECGRGLTVVAALSDRWGCERTGHNRKVVWALLAVADQRRQGTQHPEYRAELAFDQERDPGAGRHEGAGDQRAGRRPG